MFIGGRALQARLKNTDDHNQQHLERRRRVVDAFNRNNQAVRLSKNTSNLFRTRAQNPGAALNVRDLNNPLNVDADAGWVDVEGMTTYQDLVDATLPLGVMPTVVPQLKSITVGGAVSGIGIESSSFRYGLPHESVLSMDVLTGDGRVVTATPDNDARDLFFALPNSYGTLGYILKLRIATVDVKPFVKIEHHQYDSIEVFFESMRAACDDADNDFVDATIFDTARMILSIGRFSDSAPYTSDYTWMKMYFRSLRERNEDYLNVEDYLWRWDTDWFWCSKHVYAQTPLVRLLAGRRYLNSITYQKIMRFNNRWGLLAKIDSMRAIHSESVIQDVDIPIDGAAEFLRFFHEEIGIKPIWACPIRSPDPSAHFDLYPLNPEGLYVNFGFWDVIRGKQQYAAGHFNRKIERKVEQLGGVKSLYSDSYYTESDFWNIYNGSSYEACKDKYDPDRRFRNLYEKCVLSA